MTDEQIQALREQLLLDTAEVNLATVIFFLGMAMKNAPETQETFVIAATGFAKILREVTTGKRSEFYAAQMFDAVARWATAWEPPPKPPLPTPPGSGARH